MGTPLDRIADFEFRIADFGETHRRHGSTLVTPFFYSLLPQTWQKSPAPRFAPAFVSPVTAALPTGKWR